MSMTTTLRVLSLFFFLSLSKICMAQDWAKPLEASTAPTDYQEILEKNLTAYAPSIPKIIDINNLSTYEKSLTQHIQSLSSTIPNTRPQARNWSPATIVSTVTVATSFGGQRPVGSTT